MSAIKTLVEHNGVDYSAVVMTVKKTTLGREDHGIWTAYLHCEGDGIGIGVGGHTLDDIPKNSLHDNKRHGTAYGMDLIMELTSLVGVENWEQLPGQKVFVLFEGTNGWGSVAKGIANIDTGKVLILQEHAQMWRGLKA